MMASNTPSTSSPADGITRRHYPFSLKSTSSNYSLRGLSTSPMQRTPSPAGLRRHLNPASTELKQRREERLRMIHERQQEEQERKEKALHEHQEKLERVQAQKEADRLAKIRQTREREQSRHRAVMERRRQQEDAEKERKQSLVNKLKENDKNDLKRQQNKTVYAFGSSTPRALAYLNNLDTSQQVYDTKLIAQPLTPSELEGLKESRSSLDTGHSRSVSRNVRVAFGSVMSQNDETPKRGSTGTVSQTKVTSPAPSASNTSARSTRPSRTPVRAMKTNQMTQSVYVPQRTRKAVGPVELLKKQSNVMTQSFTTGDSKVRSPIPNPRRSAPRSGQSRTNVQSSRTDSDSKRGTMTNKTTTTPTGRPAKSPKPPVPKAVTKKRDAPSSKSRTADGQIESTKAVVSPPSTPPDMKRSKSGSIDDVMSSPKSTGHENDNSLVEEMEHLRSSYGDLTNTNNSDKENLMPEEQLVVITDEPVIVATDSKPETSGDLLDFVVDPIVDEQLPGMVPIDESDIATHTEQTEAAAKAALAEKRRIAREEREIQLEAERQLEEEMRKAEEERRLREEEEFRRQEEAELRLAEELRRQEEERLQQLIEEQKRQTELEAEQAALEEKRRQQEEEEARIERQRQEEKRLENEGKLRREQQEREERKQRLSAIMSRVGKSPATPSVYVGSDSVSSTPVRVENPPIIQTTPMLSATSTKVMQRLAESGSTKVLSSILKRHGSNPNVAEDQDYNMSQNMDLMTTSFPALPQKTSTPRLGVSESDIDLMSEQPTEYGLDPIHTASSSHTAILVHLPSESDGKDSNENVIISSESSDTTNTSSPNSVIHVKSNYNNIVDFTLNEDDSDSGAADLAPINQKVATSPLIDLQMSNGSFGNDFTNHERSGSH